MHASAYKSYLEEQKDAQLKKQKHKEIAAANEARVIANIKAKGHAPRQKVQRQE